MHQLFPPYLNKGSRDLGHSGPVRMLQTALLEFHPGLARAVGFVANGNYDEATAILVVAVQDIINHRASIDERIEIDGNFGPATRKGARDFVYLWPLDDYASIEFFPGSECMYVGPDSPEPILWNPLTEVAATITITDTDDFTTETM